MKRFAISALALTMLTGAAVPGFAGQTYGPAQVQQVQYDSGTRVIIKKKVVRKKHVERRDFERRQFQRKHWRAGQRVPAWQRKHVDHKRYNLRRPGRGQQWVRVDNDYLLIALGTGLIISAINAR